MICPSGFAPLLQIFELFSHFWVTNFHAVNRAIQSSHRPVIQHFVLHFLHVLFYCRFSAMHSVFIESLEMIAKFGIKMQKWPGSDVIIEETREGKLKVNKAISNNPEFLPVKHFHCCYSRPLHVTSNWK